MCYDFCMKIGYARVSDKMQKLDRQIAALKKAGCKKVFYEKQSGKSTNNRPELEKAIQALSPTDVLILAEWDRATRSMTDGIRIMERVHERFAAIKVLDRKWLDLTTPIGKGILAFLSALAEDERERINRRSDAGRKAARHKGVKFGRKPALTPYQQNEALEMLEAGKSLRAVGRTFGVNASTIQRLRDR